AEGRLLKHERRVFEEEAEECIHLALILLEGQRRGNGAYFFHKPACRAANHRQEEREPFPLRSLGIRRASGTRRYARGGRRAARHGSAAAFAPQALRRASP